MSKRTKVQSIIFTISLFMRISLIIAAAIEIYFGRWLTLFVTLLALLLMFFPAVLKKNYKITLPIEFEFSIVAFIYASIYLGEMLDFYGRFEWWDLLLHSISAMILATIGFLLIHLLNENSKIKFDLTPFFVSLFAFCFAFTIGALWEIFEYSMDIIFGLDMLKTQVRGIHDTFKDLIVDAISALIVSVGGYFYAKKHRVSIVEKLATKIIKKNN